MATNNIVNVGLSGATGTGSFVGSTSPTLVTPTLGAANATSINFGGGVYNTFVPKTAFTPTFTFDTPGDLSVSYATQTGNYSTDGSVLNFGIVLVCTPTFTTASGNIKIAGLPTAASASLDAYLLDCANSSNITYGVARTQINGLISSGNTFANLVGSGSGQAQNILTISNITSGVSTTIRLVGFYFI